MPASNHFFPAFLRLTRAFFNSADKVKIRLTTMVLAALTVLQMVMAVLITQWSAGLFNALEQHSMPGLLRQAGLLVLLFFADMALTGWHLVVKRNLTISWRDWLTEHVFGRWMQSGRHYLISHLPGEHDNPDGRIAEDCRVATESAVSLAHSLFYSVLLLVGFTRVLWTHSGVVTLDLGFVSFPVYGHLVWIAIAYSALASWLGWLVSLPLTGATNERQSAEAKFRASLVEAQENSQTIALIHAETCERHQFRELFTKIRLVFDVQTKAWRNILMFGTGYSVLSMAFPVLVCAPRYILGRITLGTLMQSAQAFQHMASALSWPVHSAGSIAEWRASVERVLGLLTALETVDAQLAQPDRWIQLKTADRPVLAFRNLCLTAYDGTVLTRDLNAEILPGERVLITGNTFTGARLFRAIAGIRPWGSGVIELPSTGRMFFMPPRPHLPAGTLRTDGGDFDFFGRDGNGEAHGGMFGCSRGWSVPALRADDFGAQRGLVARWLEEQRDGLRRAFLFVVHPFVARHGAVVLEAFARLNRARKHLKPCRACAGATVATCPRCRLWPRPWVSAWSWTT